MTAQHTMPLVQARSFTSTYDSAEDRIRVVINYDTYEQRLDVWLTRALFIKLIPMLDEFIETHEIKTEVQTVSKEQKKATIQATFQGAQQATDTSTLAVMEKEPLLLRSVDMSFIATTGDFVILFKTDTVHAKSTLKANHARVILRSIFNAAPHIAWGISPRLI